MAMNTPEEREASPARPRFATSFQRALQLAQEESRYFLVGYIGTEHLVAGMVREGGQVSQALQHAGLDARYVRGQIEAINGRDILNPYPANMELTLTSRAKKAIMLAVENARVSGKLDVDAEDLLHGVYREGEGIGVVILEMSGASRKRVLQELQRLRTNP